MKGANLKKFMLNEGGFDASGPFVRKMKDLKTDTI